MLAVETTTVPDAGQATIVDEPGFVADELRGFAGAVVDGDTVSA